MTVIVVEGNISLDERALPLGKKKWKRVLWSWIKKKKKNFRLHATNEKILLKEIEKRFVELDKRE